VPELDFSGKKRPVRAAGRKIPHISRGDLDEEEVDLYQRGVMRHETPPRQQRNVSPRQDRMRERLHEAAQVRTRVKAEEDFIAQVEKHSPRAISQPMLSPGRSAASAKLETVSSHAGEQVARSPTVTAAWIPPDSSVFCWQAHVLRQQRAREAAQEDVPVAGSNWKPDPTIPKPFALSTGNKKGKLKRGETSGQERRGREAGAPEGQLPPRCTFSSPSRGSPVGGVQEDEQEMEYDEPLPDDMTRYPDPDWYYGHEGYDERESVAEAHREEIEVHRIAQFADRYAVEVTEQEWPQGRRGGRGIERKPEPEPEPEAEPMLTKSEESKVKVRSSKAQDKFEELDVDGSGQLEDRELFSLAEWVWKSFRPGQNITEEDAAKEAAKIMRRCDTNGDGSLDGEEFRAYYAQTSEAMIKFNKKQAKKKAADNVSENAKMDLRSGKGRKGGKGGKGGKGAGGRGAATEAEPQREENTFFGPLATGGARPRAPRHEEDEEGKFQTGQRNVSFSPVLAVEEEKDTRGRVRRVAPGGERETEELRRRGNQGSGRLEEDDEGEMELRIETPMPAARSKRKPVLFYKGKRMDGKEEALLPARGRSGGGPRVSSQDIDHDAKWERFERDEHHHHDPSWSEDRGRDEREEQEHIDEEERDDKYRGAAQQRPRPRQQQEHQEEWEDEEEPPRQAAIEAFLFSGGGVEELEAEEHNQPRYEEPAEDTFRMENDRYSSPQRKSRGWESYGPEEEELPRGRPEGSDFRLGVPLDGSWQQGGGARRRQDTPEEREERDQRDLHMEIAASIASDVGLDFNPTKPNKQLSQPEKAYPKPKSKPASSRRLDQLAKPKSQRTPPAKRSSREATPPRVDLARSTSVDEFLAMEQLTMGPPARSTPEPLKEVRGSYRGSPARSTNLSTEEPRSENPSRASQQMADQQRRWQAESDDFRSKIHQAKGGGRRPARDDDWGMDEY